MPWEVLRLLLLMMELPVTGILQVLLGVKDYPQINLMHAEYFAGIGKYDYVGVALPTNE